MRQIEKNDPNLEVQEQIGHETVLDVNKNGDYNATDVRKN